MPFEDAPHNKLADCINGELLWGSDPDFMFGRSAVLCDDTPSAVLADGAEG